MKSINELIRNAALVSYGICLGVINFGGDQDSYGSLAGYIAHIKQPGQWVQHAPGYWSSQFWWSTILVVLLMMLFKDDN